MRRRHCGEGRCGNGFRTRAAEHEDWKWFTFWRWRSFWRGMRAVAWPSCRVAGRSDAGETGWNLSRKTIDSQFSEDLQDYSAFTLGNLSSVIASKGTVIFT